MAKLNKNDHKAFDIWVKVAKGAVAAVAAAGTFLVVNIFTKDKDDDDKQKKDGNKA